MTTKIDHYINARLQACCLNYNHYLRNLLGERHRIDSALSYSLQLTSLTRDQTDSLMKETSLPRHLKMFIDGFDGKLSEEEFNSPRFAYRVFFLAKTVNRRGQADEVIEFIRSDSPAAEAVHHQYTLVKEVERPKYLASDVVKLMKSKGFQQFNMHCHTQLWKARDARNSGKGFGTWVGKTWYWYEPWVSAVEQDCREQFNR